MCEVIILICVCGSVLKGSRLQVPCIRSALGRGCAEAGRGADTCQKRSQADGSDLSLFVQGRKGAQVSGALPRGFHAAQPLGGWASALTPELLGEAGVAVAGSHL